MLNPKISLLLCVRLRLGHMRIISCQHILSYSFSSSGTVENPPKCVPFKQCITSFERKIHCPVKVIPIHSLRLFSTNTLHEKSFLNKIKPNSFQLRHFSSEVPDGISNKLFHWLSDSAPVYYAQKLLLFLHESTGLPWWATIVLTTILLRTVVTLPLAIYQTYILAKYENIQILEMPEIVNQLKKETAYAIKKFSWTKDHALLVYKRSVKKQWLKLVMRDNCHPFKAGALIWVQLPMWISISAALRNLALMLPENDIAAQLTLLELSMGGVGWIHNLAVPDQTLILPVFLGALNLAIIELQSMSKIKTENKLRKFALNSFRLLSIIMVPISATVPTCMSLYWVTSSTYGLIQNMVMLSPQFRRSVGIPETPSELKRPYSHIVSETKGRINRLLAWRSESKE